MKKLHQILALLLALLTISSLLPAAFAADTAAGTAAARLSDEAGVSAASGGSSCAAAGVSTGTNVYGQFRSCYDEEYAYRFTLSSPGYVELITSYDYCSYGKIFFELYDSSHTNLLSQYLDLPSAEQRTSPRVGLPAGTYYVVVSHMYNSRLSTLNYVFRLNYTRTSCCETELNNDANHADPIALNQTYLGSNATGGYYDTDFYRFTLTSAGTVTVKFNPTYAAEGTCWYITVYQANSSGYLGSAVKSLSCSGKQTSHTMTLTNLSRGAYFLQVRNGTENTNYAFRISTVGSSAKALSTPKITALKNQTSGIQIVWGKVSGAAKYRVFRKNGSSWKALGTTASTSFVDKTAKSGTRYTYTVRCLSSDGKSYTSSYDKTGKTLLRLAAPKLKNAKKVSGGIKVTWDKVSGASAYCIYRKTGNGSWQRIAKNVTSSGYTDKTAKSGKTYTYTVRAVRDSIMSSYYSGVKITYKK